MKKIFVSITTLLVCAMVFAQPSLKKIWETDSVTLRNPESVLYDPLSNSLYVSSMNSGAIVRFDTKGNVIKNNWVTGLTTNKGLALYNGLLYTAEPSAVAVIDISKATIIKRINASGAIMLNDVAVDLNGIVYVSDTRASKVYRIENDSAVVYLENMPGANGLLTVKKDLYVLTSTSVQKVNAEKTITKIADGFESGLDGIVMIAKNKFIVSNYQGMLYYVKADGTKEILSDTRSKKIMANDISYNSKTKMLFVPSFNTSSISAYKVK